MLAQLDRHHLGKEGILIAEFRDGVVSFILRDGRLVK